MRYFKEEEFYCKCGRCNPVGVVPKLEEMLDDARGVARIPFKITSGFRCFKHNEAVGAKRSSSHCKGLAVDIATPDARSKRIIHKSLDRVGFTRFGIGNGFIHVDIDQDKTPELQWDYYKYSK